MASFQSLDSQVHCFANILGILTKNSSVTWTPPNKDYNHQTASVKAIIKIAPALTTKRV